MSTITTRDGTEIYYKDWGEGPVITFSHGWPLNADAWESQLMFFAQNGYRAIAHDRRGHGRSTQTSEGNEMNTYANDLAELIDALNLTDITMVGHSTGGGEVTRYIGRFGTTRVARVALISAVPPHLLKGPDNPSGVPIEECNEIRAALLNDRGEFYRKFAQLFFGLNRPNGSVSKSVTDLFWDQCMAVGLKNTYECVKAFSETDFTDDLKKFDVPTLFLHGEDDQVVPLAASAKRAARLVSDAQEIYYKGAPHGITTTLKDRVNADLLDFIRSTSAQVSRAGRQTANVGA